MTLDRVLPYWHEAIAPRLAEGETVMIAAHGNSLRALVKYLDGISEADIVELNHSDRPPPGLRPRPGPRRQVKPLFGRRGSGQGRGGRGRQPGRAVKLTPPVFGRSSGTAGSVTRVISTIRRDVVGGHQRHAEPQNFRRYAHLGETAGTGRRDHGGQRDPGRRSDRRSQHDAGSEQHDRRENRAHDHPSARGASVRGRTAPRARRR